MNNSIFCTYISQDHLHHFQKADSYTYVSYNDVVDDSRMEAFPTDEENTSAGEAKNDDTSLATTEINEVRKQKNITQTKRKHRGDYIV